jgi:hypothetical protein
MSTSINPEHFTRALYMLLDEAFDNVHGLFLDKGDSMFETLATISAADASIPVGDKCATLAAQVKHTAFYLDVLIHNVRTQQYEKQDWGKIWRETGAVTSAEWETIKTDLRASYDRLKQLIADTPEWPSDWHLAGAMAAIAHTAFHLGQVRQSLCVLR